MPKTEKKENEMLCGCHTVRDRGIIFCQSHSAVTKMMAVLNMLRSYFIDTTGEASPFVQKIDELLPRKKKEVGP